MLVLASKHIFSLAKDSSIIEFLKNHSVYSGIEKKTELELNLLDCRPVISMMKLWLHLLNSEFRSVFQIIAKLLVEKDQDFCSIEKGSLGKAPFWVVVWLPQQ